MSRNRTARDAPEASTRSWHDRPADAACADVDSTAGGLTQCEAHERLRRFGPNALPAPHPPSLFAIGLRQLQSPLIYILLAAAVGSLLLGHASDAGFIGFVLLVNSLLGGWQEWNAERQSLGLRQLMRIRATVLRDGEAREIDAEELVPGDVVTLESGQRTPADLRLLTAHGLEIDEALLTGESLPVTKDPAWSGPAAASLGDRRNMAYSSSLITYGQATGIVVATADRTEQLADGFKQILGHAGAFENQPHEGKERDGQQRIVIHHAAKNAFGQSLEKGRLEQTQLDTDPAKDNTVGGQRKGYGETEQQEENQ